MTLRQIWVRFRAVQMSADWEESATRAAVQADLALDEARRKSSDIDDVMRMVGGGQRA